MLVDSMGSWKMEEGKKKWKPKTQTKRTRQQKAIEANQERNAPEEQNPRQQRCMAKGTLHNGINVHDLKELQVSLVSMEVMLHALLQGIGEDHTCKRSFACKKPAKKWNA